MIIAALLLLVLMVSGWAAYSAWECGRTVVTTRYTLQADVTESLRIVHLTDLHGMEYGNDNDYLVEMIARETPDLIFMTGDMLTGDDSGPEVACRLIEKLVDIAPVYYGYGNHEKEWEARTGESLSPALTEAGAVVLDTAHVDVTVKGQALRIGGYHGYYRQPGMYHISEKQHKVELDFAEQFERTDRLKLLLCHIPTAWLDWEYINCYPVDVVFSGHYHGGQVRLPGIGGLAAPYVGLFPEYTKGVFYGERAVCVLSAGVGTEENIPRINNFPEVVIVELVSERENT